MNQKSFVLQNSGMNRDLSISKVGQSSAFENHNIRIIARDHDTLLSVTNERGTKEINLGENVEIQGTLVGWNVVDNHIILFTHDESFIDEDYPDTDPDVQPSESEITYRYKVVTTLSTSSIMVGGTATAKATLYRKTLVNGVPVSGWQKVEQGSNVTSSGFTATSATSSVTVSGSTVTGAYLGEATIKSNYANADEYDNAKIVVQENSTTLVTEYKVKVVPQSNSVEVGSSIFLRAFRYKSMHPSGQDPDWPSNYELEVTGDGFVVSVGDDDAVEIDSETNILTALSESANIEIRSNHTVSQYTVTYEDAEISITASGGGSGGGGGDIPVMGGLTFNVSASWLSETSLQYFLQIENSNPTPATINGIAVRLVQTETQQDLPSEGELVRMVDCGEGQITIPALDSSEPIIKTIENISYTEGYTLWIQGVATNYYNGDYSPIDEYQEGPSDTMSLLALSGSVETPDRIYRIDYIPGREDGEFVMVRGKYDPEDFETGSGSGSGSGSGHTVPDNKYNVPLFEGNLHLSANYPIESIVSSESDDIQKIYWVDGRNVLRFMNVVEEGTVDALTGDLVMPWDGDNTYFDSNRGAGCGVTVNIEKDNTGNTRANGVVQYSMTYFNEHGQETGSVWTSDLIYLSPIGSGGAADETNNNKVTLTIDNMAVRGDGNLVFDHFRIYSVFRSSLNGEAVAYLVTEQKTTTDSVIVVDDGAHLAVQDTTRLLYLGSQAVIAGTMTHKDQTLFLGDLRSIGKRSIARLEYLIKNNMFGDPGEQSPEPFNPGQTWKSRCVSFVYTNDSDYGTANKPEVDDFSYVSNVGNYPYENQLVYSSSKILTFKGGEKYRFALKFKYKDGTETDAFWIGDATNYLYPVIDVYNNKIKRVVAVCSLPTEIISFMKTSPDNYDTVQLLVAEATDADRSVKAQGIVNPTVFNVWERFSDRLYAMPSWISRPRGSQFAFRHFEPIGDCTTSVGEIQCNYWNSKIAPAPYYQYDTSGTTNRYTENFDGDLDFTHIFFVYKIKYSQNFLTYRYDVTVRIVKANLFDQGYLGSMSNYNFTQSSFYDMPYHPYNTTDSSKNGWHYYADPDGKYTIEARVTDEIRGKGLLDDDLAITECYNNMRENLHNIYGIPFYFIVSYDTFEDWCEATTSEPRYYHSASASVSSYYTDAVSALNYDRGEPERWQGVSSYQPSAASGRRTPAYGKKHLMFVDENVITLDSPELTYGASLFDKAGYKFRLVGVAKMSSVVSDYIVDATHSSTPGAPMDDETFSGNIINRGNNIHGILSWPLWKEYGLNLSGDTDKEVQEKNYTPSEYSVGNTVVRYWLYMWQHSGIISGYNNISDDQEVNQAKLMHKTFANLRFSYNTIYFDEPYDMSDAENDHDYTESIRVVNDLNDSYNNIHVDGKDTYYTNKIQLSLTVPGKLRYPIVYSPTRPDETSKDISSDSAFLYTDSPCLIQYRSGTHAVINFKTETTSSKYRMRVLPWFFNDEPGNVVTPDSNTTGALLPWVGEEVSYEFVSDGLTFGNNHDLADEIEQGNQYLFIGEIYRDFSAGSDTRYGGITEAALINNRFIPAGPQYLVENMSSNAPYKIYGNQGDTYFQRWDCLRTKPYSDDAENKVIDITSVMLETHINLDGRTDLQRGLAEVASIDTANYGSLNRVYSQQNNMSVRRDLDDEYNTDSYRSSITWTLPKSDVAATDEWTHITLASSLKLDADRGICRALRRYNNSIIAFQDKAISEVMFNSRTQLTTSDGVPVEIANSGKVDGNRYLSDKYGCINKWSIVEGKAGLYFVDNINKAFCSLGAGNGGFGVDNISTNKGFGVWFRNGNNLNPWMPSVFNNFVSYYDKIHSDVYLVRKEGEAVEGACLVYNELLGKFTSFFDYGSVPMMTNVNDRFISFNNGSLWLQNEGSYGEFFGTAKPFWVQYRVTPEPYGDKIWTNVEYRADFYRLLDDEVDNYLVEKDITDDVGIYLPNETFDYMRFWNEYQTTEDDESAYSLTPEKRFRIWRLAIPRAMKNINNPYGLDRIRNPWLNLLFKKNAPDENSKNDIMQLHDIIVTYYE